MNNIMQKLINVISNLSCNLKKFLHTENPRRKYEYVPAIMTEKLLNQKIREI